MNLKMYETFFFDTETTGLTSEDEIFSISIIDDNGKVLLDTLVKPEHHNSNGKVYQLL